MEDQQPATGDLTDVIPDNESGDQSVETEAAETDAAETEVEQPEAPAHPPARRPVGRWVAIAVGVAAAMFVGSAAFAGAAVQPYLADRATVNTKLEVARTAADAIRTLWTYTPDNIDKLSDRAAHYLSGDFGAEYRKFIDKVIPPSKQTQVTNNTEVTGAAVESLNGPNAVALVYTNTTATSPLTKNIPALKYYSCRLTMKREHSRWLVTKMNIVTSLDLTPQF
ncbi:MAG: mammalian cell entry protein [Mycobacterium sp.]